MLDAVTATSICPGPGGTRSNATNSSDSRSPGVRICSRMPSRSCSTTVVCRSSGRSGPGAAARCTTRRCARRSRPPPNRSAAAAPPARPSVVVVHVDLGGAQVRMFGVDHPHQAAQPGLLQVGQVAGQHAGAFLVTHVQPRRFAGKLGEFAGDARPGGARIRRPRWATGSCGSPFWRPRQHHHTREPPVAAAERSRSDSASTRSLGVAAARTRRALRALGLQRVGQLGRQRIGRVGRADQQPGSRVGPGDVGQVALLPFDGQQPLVQQSIGAARCSEPPAPSRSPSTVSSTVP